MSFAGSDRCRIRLPPRARTTRSYRRVAFALIPFLFVCYIVAMIDRLNVGYAKLQFMADLHFDEAVFGVAAGGLYLGYILLEIPSNLLLERVGLRLTLLRIMSLWGCARWRWPSPPTVGAFIPSAF